MANFRAATNELHAAASEIDPMSTAREKVAQVAEQQWIP
jgi:hypothetical protein